MSTRRPSARTASLAVCQDTPSPAATRDTVRWSITIPSSAHRIPRRDSFARSAAAAVRSSRQERPHPEHLYRRTRTSSMVGRYPNGSCASCRVSVPRESALLPQPRHHGSGSATRHSITARSGASRWPTATRPSSSRRQNTVRSGVAKVAWSTSRSSSGWSV